MSREKAKNVIEPDENLPNLKSPKSISFWITIGLAAMFMLTVKNIDNFKKLPALLFDNRIRKEFVND